MVNNSPSSSNDGYEQSKDGETAQNFLLMGKRGNRRNSTHAQEPSGTQRSEDCESSTLRVNNYLPSSEKIMNINLPLDSADFLVVLLARSSKQIQQLR